MRPALKPSATLWAKVLWNLAASCGAPRGSRRRPGAGEFRAGGREGGPGLGSVRPHAHSLEATSSPSDLSHAAHCHCLTCCRASAQSHGPRPRQPELRRGERLKTPPSHPSPSAPPALTREPGARPGLAGPCRTGCCSRNPIISGWSWRDQEREPARQGWTPLYPPWRQVLSEHQRGWDGENRLPASSATPAPGPPPAPSSPEPPPAPGDLLPPSQTPGVPAPAPGGPQAPRAAMPLAPIYPQQPGPSFRPAGSHLLPEAFPDSVAPPAVGRCWCRLLVLGVVPPSSDTGLPFPTETVSRGRGRAAGLLLSAPEDSAGQASAGPWLSTFRARQHPRRAG